MIGSQIKILQLTNNDNATATKSQNADAPFIGQKSIIRTYSAGVWFGTVVREHGEKIELTSARRMWRWHAKEGISLSACALYGVSEDGSRIEPPVSSVWLLPIEIIECTDNAIKSLENIKNAQQDS